MIYADKYAEAERELRIVIDNMMRQELELLQAALERDRTQKGENFLILYLKDCYYFLIAIIACKCQALSEKKIKSHSEKLIATQ